MKEENYMLAFIVFLSGMFAGLILSIIIPNQGSLGSEEEHAALFCGAATRVLEVHPEGDRLYYEVQTFRCTNTRCDWRTTHTLEEYRWQVAVDLCALGGKARPAPRPVDE